MKLVSVWSDLYASTVALYQGRPGGYRWLIATPPAHATAAAEVLTRLDGKGETVLLVYPALTPLEAALREQTDPLLGRGLSGVLVIDRALASGPEVVVAAAEQHAETTGLTYQEGGHYPAWADALGEAGASGASPAASVCAGLGLPVRVCAPDGLEAALTGWWAATPHALVQPV